MAATTAIPPRRDRKRTATRARASAGMQMRGANVQHSNAQGHSATGGCTASAAGLSGGPRRYHLVPVRASRLWITSLFTWTTCPRTDEPRASRARSLLNAAFTPAAANWPEHDATVQRGTPDATGGRAARDAFSGWSSRWSSRPHRQNPPPSSGTRAAPSSPRRARPLATPAGSSRAAPASGSRCSGARSTASRTSSRSIADPRRLDALPRRRRSLAAARRARHLGHARGRARHLRPHRPPLHPVAEPVRRRQVVPQGRHVAAPAHRLLALRLALHDRLSDALRPHPVPARRAARRSRELRGQHRLGPQPGHHGRRASGTGRPRPTARSCCSSS